MSQELKVEDLIATGQDGTRQINHDLLTEFGLFNLPKPVMRSALMVYYENAERRAPEDARVVRTFIHLANTSESASHAMIKQGAWSWQGFESPRGTCGSWRKPTPGPRRPWLRS